MRFITSIAAALLLSTAANAETLQLYTSQSPEIAQQTVDAFQKKYPDIKVEWMRNGTSQLMNILRAEIEAGQIKPDLLLVADTINLGSLKKEGLLLAYPQAPVASFDEGTYDKDKTFFGTKLLTTAIAYNSKNAEPVKSWADLLKPENDGQIAVPSPLYSGAALNHLHAVTNNEAIGWNFYEGLAKLNIAPEGGNGPALKAVAGGMVKYGIIADADIIRAKAKGSPVDIVFPSEGVSFITEPVAIMKSSRNPEAAKKFVDFLLSQDGQKLVLEQGNLPLDPSLPVPQGFPKRSEIKLIPMDADKAVENDQAVRQKFTEIFGG
ncbi:ABC transporter substrate-binding protein [Brucellaceae bacterium D45D]